MCFRWASERQERQIEVCGHCRDSPCRRGPAFAGYLALSYWDGYGHPAEKEPGDTYEDFLEEET